MKKRKKGKKKKICDFCQKSKVGIQVSENPTNRGQWDAEEVVLICDDCYNEKLAEVTL